jgi:hypothetical protein
MDDSPHYPDASPPGTGTRPEPAVPDRAPKAGAPRWAKVAGIIIGALVIAVALAMLIGGGSHGPGRHTGENPPSAVTESGAGGHTPPMGGHTP